MDLGSFFLIAFLANSSIFIGCITLFFVPEEKLGRSYFIGIQKTLFFASIIAALYFSGFNYLIVFICLVFAILFLYYPHKQYVTSYLLYGLFFYGFSNNFNALSTFAIIVFGHGLVVGALLSNEKKKKESLKQSLLYFFFTLLTIILKLSL